MNIYIEPETLEKMVTNKKETLKSMSVQQPVLLVFLRHFGCVFCKEALADLSAKKDDFEKKGIQMVFVHMAEDAVAEEYFEKYKLSGVAHISDPFAHFYKAFGIRKASFSQLYGLSTWIRGYSAKKEGHQLELAKHLGDSKQMPGIFLLQDGVIKEKFLHKLPSDRPDYNELVDCCQKA